MEIPGAGTWAFNQYEVYRADNLEAGAHTIAITPEGGYSNLDAFMVLNPGSGADAQALQAAGTGLLRNFRLAPVLTAADGEIQSADGTCQEKLTQPSRSLPGPLRNLKLLRFPDPGTHRYAGAHGHSGADRYPGTHGHSGADRYAGAHGHSGADRYAGAHGHPGAHGYAGAHGHRRNPTDTPDPTDQPEAYGSAGRYGEARHCRQARYRQPGRKRRRI